MDKNLFNVLLLSFAFHLIYIPTNTMLNIQKIFVDSIREQDKTFKGDAYISLGVAFTSLAICSWISPFILPLIGTKTCMILGTTIHLAMIVQFLYPRTWLFYVMSVVVGLGGSLLWYGQGIFLTMCSTASTVSRNALVFWVLLQCTVFPGNLFIYFQFEDKIVIDNETRTFIVYVFVVLCVIGILLLCILQQIYQSRSSSMLMLVPPSGLSIIKQAGKLIETYDMRLLIISFIYTGMNLSLLKCVYGTSVGYTRKLSEAPKKYVGLASLSIGTGEIVSRGLITLFSSTVKRIGRDVCFTFAFIIHIVSLILIYGNLPNSSSLHETDDIAIINPPQLVSVMLCAFTLGFSDGCFINLITLTIDIIFPEQLIAAITLFISIHAGGLALGLFGASYFGLHFKIVAIFIVGIFGSICYCFVEWAIIPNVIYEEDDDFY